jgi:hypothetical protein
MTVKNVLKLNAKYAILFLKFIIEIEIKLNIFALIATRLYTFGNLVRMFPYTNAAMINVPFFYLTKTNLISLKNFYPKLNLLSLSLDTNSENFISLMNN